MVKKRYTGQQQHQADIGKKELPKIFNDVEAKTELHIEDEVGIKIIAADQQKDCGDKIDERRQKVRAKLFGDDGSEN